MTVTGIPRGLVALLLAGTALVIGVAVLASITALSRDSQSSVRLLSATRALDVQVNRGDVSVVGTGRRNVQLTTTTQRTIWGKAHTSVRTGPGRVVLDATCPASGAMTFGDCAEFVLEVPRGTRVHVTTSSGDVHGEGLTATADLSASSGDIHADGVTGALRARTGSGDIDVSDGGAVITARASSGDVDISSRNPRRIVAQAGSGDVSVSVPDLVYTVDARAESGDRSVDVRQRPGAPRTLVAKAGSGDVHVAADR